MSFFLLFLLLPLAGKFDKIDNKDYTYRQLLHSTHTAMVLGSFSDTDILHYLPVHSDMYLNCKSKVYHLMRSI